MHRYWRIFILDRQAGAANTVSASEIQLRSSKSGSDETGAGTAAASSSFNASYLPANAFDDDTNTAWVCGNGLPWDSWISYDFGLGVTKDIIEVSWTARVALTDAPIDFFLQYSDDNTNWTTVFVWLNQIGWVGGDTRVFNNDTSGVYTDLISPHNMTSNILPAPFVASASTEYSASYRAFLAFYTIGRATNFWATTTNTGYLKIDLGSGNAEEINTFAILSNSLSQPNRAPRDFTLQGSNDDSNWDVLGTYTGETSWGNAELRSFNLSATGLYRYYKLDITANNGDALVAVAMLYLLQYNSLVHYTFEVAAGSYSLTGTDAEVLRDSVFGASAGAYALTGSDIELLKGKGYTFSVGSGSFTITGQEISLLHDKVMAAGSGSYALTGSDITLLRTYIFNSGAGSYVITGADLVFVYMQIIADGDLGWKADRNLGAWAFTEQTDKFGYINNKNWSKMPAAVAFSESLNLQIDREDDHKPCGHWHRKRLPVIVTKTSPVSLGQWVAAMPKPETDYIYLYDITYKAVIKLEAANPPKLREVLPLDSLYALDESKGYGNPGAQRGGYCMSKDGNTLWYLFRTDLDCQLIEVDISGVTMSITKKTTFTGLATSSQSIQDGCCDNTHTYWCTSLIDGRLIKIRNSDHVIVIDNLIHYSVAQESINSIDYSVSTGKLYWTYVIAANDARHNISDTDFNIESVLVSFCIGGGINQPIWWNMLRVVDDYVLHHRAYNPGWGYCEKRNLDLTCTGKYIKLSYLQNILGSKDGYLFVFWRYNSVSYPAYISRIRLGDMADMGAVLVTYYAGPTAEWAWTSVSAMSKKSGIIALVRWNHVEQKNYVACFSADASLNFICDTPLYQIETTTVTATGNTELLSAEPVVWSMD